ncbi:MAG: hypothetical protein WC942_07945 [Clostridia bacterium]
MTVFDTLSQLWVEKEIKDLVVGDLIKQEDEQVDVIEKIDIDKHNTIILYLKPHVRGE